MSKLFGNLGTDGLEEAEDRIGGFAPLDTDAYDVTIKAMYAGQSDSGAQNVTVIGDVNGREYKETIYITNRKGDNFWLNDAKKKVPLPGFTTIDHICLATTGAPLCEQETEDKVVNIYDRDAGKEVPKTVPMLTGPLGKTVTLGILRILANKSKKEGSGYVDIAETREFNEIDKVFDTESKMTVVEAQNGAEEASFYTAWTDKNRGNTRDKRTIKDGETGQAGRPTPGGAGKTERKSLFGGQKAA